MINKRIFAMIAVTGVLLGLIGCKKTEDPLRPESDVIAVTGVEIEPQTLTLFVGETGTLAAKIIPENASDKHMTWSTADASIASVNDNGAVTAVATGETTITVKTVDGGKTAACKVAVSKKPIHIERVSLDQSEITLEIGGAPVTLVATVFPEDADDKSVTWKSADESVATVANGSVSPVNIGSTTITVTTTDGNKTATCKVTVTRKKVSSITLDKTEIYIAAGSDPIKITATVLPEDAADKSLEWKSSDEEVATVEDGVVTPLAKGVTVINAIAKDGSNLFSNDCIINVTKIIEPDAVDLGLSIKWASVNLGAEKPEEDGYYYAWGETEIKRIYDWDHYKFWTYNHYGYYSKYVIDGNYGIYDGKTRLEAEDDVAQAKLGKGWRMPTRQELKELQEECTWSFIDEKDHKGYKVIGKNGNSIFLPLSGYIGDTQLNCWGTHGYYWSSDLSTESSSYCDASCIVLQPNRISWTTSRYTGMTVRPVKE